MRGALVGDPRLPALPANPRGHIAGYQQSITIIDGKCGKTLDELRRREESMKAGFAARKKNEIDLEEVRQREKEIVVVLPKDTHKHEEDK
jgi:hypothetical protein